MTRRYTLTCPADLRQITLDVGKYFGMANHPLEVAVGRKKQKRSQKANRLMWAAHLDAVVRVFEGYGNELTKEEVHEWCKERFLPDEGRKAIIVNGEIAGERRSTTWLSTEGMNIYLTRLEVFIAENGGTIERVKH